MDQSLLVEIKQHISATLNELLVLLNECLFKILLQI